MYRLILVFTLSVIASSSFARDGVKTNIVHDFVGGKILTENNIEFKKIVSTRGNTDVAFCTEDRSFKVFFQEKETVKLIEKDSSKCGKVLTEDGVKENDGAGKLLGKLFGSKK